MLAASPRVSKVPPDYVKAAPVEIAAALPAQQLGESRPTYCTQSDPAEARQEDTAGDKFACPPFTVRPEHRHAAVRSEANPTAVLPGTVQDGELAKHCNTPDERSTRSQSGADGQHRDENEADQCESRGHAKDETPQRRIRMNYSGVCVG